MPTEREQPDLCAVFADLRDRWLAAGDGRTNLKLADLLGIRFQKLSNYTTGRHRVPEWLVLRMLSELRLELVTTEKWIAIRQRNRKFEADPADALATMSKTATVHGHVAAS